jgi:hypothetical protein
MWIDDLKLYNIAREYLTTEQVKSQRKGICLSCEHLTKINTCELCHCVMPAKWWLAAASCPRDLWKEDL